MLFAKIRDEERILRKIGNKNINVKIKRVKTERSKEKNTQSSDKKKVPDVVRPLFCVS